MQINARLSKKIAKAVQTSMQIEGYKPSLSTGIKAQAKSLMEQRHVKVSVRDK